MLSEYDRQRIESSKQIEAKILNRFAEQAMVIDDLIWGNDPDHEFRNLNQHMLTVIINGKNYEISDMPYEAIADYPGRVGTEIMDVHTDHLLQLIVQEK